jgi:hypothetical protein
MYITLSEKIQSQSTDSQKILPGRSAIEDRGWRRRVVIEKVGAASSVVWNPWAEKAAAMADLGDPAWRGMVCVETGNIADNEVRLAADDEHRREVPVPTPLGTAHRAHEDLFVGHRHSRIEGLTKRLLRPLLTSAAFAKICPRPLVSLGFHPVRGLFQPEEVFGLPD